MPHFSAKTYNCAWPRKTVVYVVLCIYDKIVDWYTVTEKELAGPHIIWPAATHRSTWIVHPTPGWHFGRSETLGTAVLIGQFMVLVSLANLGSVQPNFCFSDFSSRRL